jgi:hypothetical protein
MGVLNIVTLDKSQLLFFGILRLRFNHFILDYLGKNKLKRGVFVGSSHSFINESVMYLVKDYDSLPFLSLRHTKFDYSKVPILMFVHDHGSFSAVDKLANGCDIEELDIVLI